MSEILRVAVVGAGQVAARHVDAFSDHPDAVAWPSPIHCCERAEALAARAGARALRRLRRRCSMPRRVDAVCVCVPHDLHLDVARAAVAAGAHLLMEKPIATTLDGRRRDDPPRRRGRADDDDRLRSPLPCRGARGEAARPGGRARNARNGPRQVLLAGRAAPARLGLGAGAQRRRRPHVRRHPRRRSHPLAARDDRRDRLRAAPTPTAQWAGEVEDGLVAVLYARERGHGDAVRELDAVRPPRRLGDGVLRQRRCGARPRPASGASSRRLRRSLTVQARDERHFHREVEEFVAGDPRAARAECARVHRAHDPAGGRRRSTGVGAASVPPSRVGGRSEPGVGAGATRMTRVRRRDRRCRLHHCATAAPRSTRERSGSLYDFYAGSGLDGVLALGTTGEGILMTAAERRRGAERAVEAAAGRFAVLIHAGAQTTADSGRARGPRRPRPGPTASRVIGPPYYAFDPDELFAHYAAAASACAPLPFYVYEFSARSGYASAGRGAGAPARARSELHRPQVSDQPWERFEEYLHRWPRRASSGRSSVHRRRPRGRRRRRHVGARGRAAAARCHGGRERRAGRDRGGRRAASGGVEVPVSGSAQARARLARRRDRARRPGTVAPAASGRGRTPPRGLRRGVV